MTPLCLARCAALTILTAALSHHAFADGSAGQDHSTGKAKTPPPQNDTMEEEEPYHQAKPIRRYTSGKVRLDRFGRPREGHRDSVPSHDSPGFIP